MSGAVRLSNFVRFLSCEVRDDVFLRPFSTGMVGPFGSVEVTSPSWCLAALAAQSEWNAEQLRDKLLACALTHGRTSFVFPPISVRYDCSTQQ